MNLFTIAPSQPFLPVLARWLLDSYGKDAQTLPRVRVLLPSRRACRSLQEAFLALSGGAPLLLPRIEPIGDMALPAACSVDLPPPVSSVRRQLLLMQLIAEFESKRLGRVYPMQKAAQLASALTQFLDEMMREELDFSVLDALVPEELAAHWQQTLDFMQIITRHWPHILKLEGVSEPVAYRNAVLKAIATHWQQHEPDYPVIAAGSTGSQPATATLLQVIAKMKQGRVMLPALDTAMEEAYWKVLEETHPQYLLKQLLDSMQVKRQQVGELVAAPANPQQDCIRQLFMPAAATAAWKESTAPLAEGLSHMRLLEAEQLLEEARLVGVLLREVLETPGKTAALITPDRTLAQMVAAQMQRFGVEVDDSAGRNLKQCPAAVFMRLVARLAASGAAPVDLLALLRHPLAAVGTDPAVCRRLSRRLEIALLRGVRFESGFAALRREAAQAGDAEMEELLQRLDDYCRPFMQLFAGRNVAPLKHLLQEHIACTEKLAAVGEGATELSLWGRESGQHLAAWMAELLDQADILQAVDPLIYPAVFDALLAQQVYWPNQSTHPRLHILSPIEARLQQYDRVILGSMNEGSWPAAAGDDPWMSRPMRSQTGLPAPEQAIGQAAHDVSLLLHAPEVFITRARKVGGQPANPSRWLVRLQTLVQGRQPELYAGMTDWGPYAAIATMLDTQAAITALQRPEPTPPVAARPRRMRVTHIDSWRADPYVTYARHILKLKKLDALDREPEGRDFGVLVHEALRRFTEQVPGPMPEDAQARLLACGREVFAAWLSKPAVASLWWPRFELLSSWLVEQEAQRRQDTSQVLAETEGQWAMDVDGQPFTLTTRIDRLEQRTDGTVALVDYKTGQVPSLQDIRRHKSNQLPLEALVVQHGSLHPAPDHLRAPELFEYWKLASRPADCAIQPVNLEAQDIENAKQMLEDLIRAFDQPDTPYAAQTDARLQLTYNDYEHLTRRAEWEAL